MVLMLNVHYSRAPDMVQPTTTNRRGGPRYRDSFGNWCSRIVAPKGRFRLAGFGLVNDSAHLNQ